MKLFEDHIGLAIVFATFWAVGVTTVYFAWVAWGGWDRGSNLALAEAVLPVAGVGYGVVVVGAAVLAFRPPQPELVCSITPHGGYGPVLTITNQGRLPASDVALEIVGGPFAVREMISESWRITESRGDPDGPDGHHLILERSRNLPNGASEFILAPELPTGIVAVTASASNAPDVVETFMPEQWTIDDFGFWLRRRDRIYYWFRAKRYGLLGR